MMTNKDLRSFREEYTMHSLDESSVPPDPLVLFDRWLGEAISSKLPEPNAMTLATVTPEGKPSARVLLLKEVDQGRFIFYTNYESDKGKELLHQPHGALVFLWLELQRQVRVSGPVSRLDAATSDAYFALRPRPSQVGAIVSPQSRIIGSREELEKAFEKRWNDAGDQVIKRPAHWGGFALVPGRIEFWQGRESRLHDRILYTNIGKEWQISRLAP